MVDRYEPSHEGFERPRAHAGLDLRYQALVAEAPHVMYRQRSVLAPLKEQVGLQILMPAYYLKRTAGFVRLRYQTYAGSFRQYGGIGLREEEDEIMQVPITIELG